MSICAIWGAPQSGKTTLAVNLAYAVSRGDKTVCLISPAAYSEISAFLGVKIPEEVGGVLEVVKKLLKDRAGGISIIFIGLVFVLLLLSLLIMEMGAAYENYYDSETILLRCCNSAVEKEISDAYRADNILYLDVSAATADFRSYLASDMPDKYTVKIKSITGTETPPALTVTGTVTFSTLFHEYSFDDVSFDFTVKSTNYRTE